MAVGLSSFLSFFLSFLLSLSPLGFSAGEKRESSRGQRERAGKRSRLESRVNSAFARVNRHSRAFLLFSLGRSAARKRARGHEKCKGERAQIISSSVENVSREFFFFFCLPSRERFQRLLPLRHNRLCGFTSSQLASLLARKKRKKEKIEDCHFDSV